METVSWNSKGIMAGLFAANRPTSATTKITTETSVEFRVEQALSFVRSRMKKAALTGKIIRIWLY
jgi:hypothetical protein